MVIQAPNERPVRSRALYQAKRRTHSVALYFRDVEEMMRFKAMATEAGYTNFNAWLLQMLSQATSGSVFPPEFVDTLKKDAEKHRTWLETARDENAQHRADLKILQQRVDRLLFLLHDLEGGPALAKQVLDEASRGVSA